MVYEISGGHLNPAVSLGVFVTTRKYYKNLLFLLFTMLAQFVGAFLTLAAGYLMRVKIKYDDDGDQMYMKPDLYSFSPPVLVNSDGAPSYG